MTTHENQKYTVGSLFSGIGGLELGLERTGGFKTIWQSEIDAYASAVLKRHWPDVPNLGDITKVNWNEVEKPDLICGGFPCQDISLAGKGAGIKEGTRSGLWKEYHKALCFLRPRLVLVENVSAFSFRGLLEVLGDLAQIGYDAEWFTLRASDVGAPHKRERLFILASDPKSQRFFNQQLCMDDWKNEGKIDPHRHPNQVQPSDNNSKRRERVWKGQVHRFSEFQSFQDVRRIADLQNRPDLPKPLFRGGRDGIPYWMDRIKCLGNAVVPQVAQVIGEAIIQGIK